MVSVQLQVFHGPGIPLSTEERDFDPVQDLAVGEVLVRIDLATICGSDLHTLDGTREEDTPCILGHEAVGRVIATHQRPELSIGDRVTWTIADSCGACPPCTEFDLPQKCDRLFKYGHAGLDQGSGLNGCYASHVVLRSGTHIVRLPDALTDVIAASANCALATMVHALDQLQRHRAALESRVSARLESVVVQGGGLLGIYACALLHEMGVEKIFCVEVNEARFPVIERFGGIPVDGRDADNPVNQILKACPRGVDAVFEVAGRKELLPVGVQLLRVGGFYAWVGLVHPDSAIGLSAESVIRKCLTIRGIHNYRPEDLDASVAFLTRNVGSLPFETLVSPAFALCDLGEAMELARGGEYLRVSVAP